MLSMVKMLDNNNSCTLLHVAWYKYKRKLKTLATAYGQNFVTIRH
jgi:hypothetical protein